MVMWIFNDLWSQFFKNNLEMKYLNDFNISQIIFCFVKFLKIYLLLSVEILIN
jgi:hypothetical protein